MPRHCYNGSRDRLPHAAVEALLIYNKDLRPEPAENPQIPALDKELKAKGSRR